MSNYKYTFFDNQTVGVDHLNEITKRLVSGGISAVYSGVDFNVTDINDTNAAILTGGVVPETDYNLKVTAIGNGKYLINQGLCFFNNGTTMEILSGGEEIVVPQGVKRYIYLVSDRNKMACYVEILENEKQTGEFILLAVINADGTITDKRTYARGKIPGFYASTHGLEVNVVKNYSQSEITRNMTIEIPVGEGDFKHLLIVGKLNRYGDSAMIYCEFENGTAVNQVSMSVEGGAGNMLLYYNHFAGSCRIDQNIKLQNGKLVMTASGNLNRDTDIAIITYRLW